ncbi:hypothetical protein ACQW02_11945 [Humitalea sp. 24SJ18S-53]|uniref:hypothetical protein n=1 Tax=Humitalea sp. 24SJ18S-53 TaxID=3422307 RepID=UPI003D67E97E
MAHCPVLAMPATFMPAALVGAFGDAVRLLVLHLMWLEAEARTDAMRELREAHGVLALPVHDSLIVPRSAEAIARSVMVDAFERLARFTPVLAVKRGAGPGGGG